MKSTITFKSRWGSKLLALFVSLTMLGATSALAAEDPAALARGGQLYDKWFKVIKAETPKGAHQAYPKSGKYRGKKGADWRCKECHGWDYMGKDGAYSKGKHHTGIKGVVAFAGSNTGQIKAVLADSNHGFKNRMSGNDLQDLALFVAKGQINMDKYIDRSSKMARGNKTMGKAYYETLCAQCHGDDGTMVKDMPAMGKVVGGNPWEGLHKILNGQPGEKMPALRALDPQIAVDILAYSQTLPKKKK